MYGDFLDPVTWSRLITPGQLDLRIKDQPKSLSCVQFCLTVMACSGEWESPPACHTPWRNFPDRSLSHVGPWIKAIWFIKIYIGMSKWWVKGWPMAACPLQAPVVLYRMLAIFTYFEIITVCGSVLAFTRIRRMFLSTDFCFRKTDLTSHHGPSLYQIYILNQW